jgi:hypothetical protein
METTKFICQDCSAEYEVRNSFLEFWAARNPEDYDYKRFQLYCRPCRQARIRAMLSGPAMRQVLEALAAAPPA